MKAASYIELALYKRAVRDTTPAEVFFSACGFGPQSLVRVGRRGSSGIAVYVKPGGQAAKIRRAFERFGPRGWKLRERLLEPADWFTKWQSTFKIAPIGRRFTIVPCWQKEKFKGKRLPIYIDPQGQFGSGMHETTRVVVGLMERLEGRFADFLDAGTGTGILMVAAARLGASKVSGFDEDPAAVASARANLAHNGVKGRLYRQDVRGEGGKYTLVAANLISSVLVDAQGALARAVADGGHLVVSGIERRNFAGFLREFRPQGLRRVTAVRGRGWCGALYRRVVK